MAYQRTCKEQQLTAAEKEDKSTLDTMTTKVSYPQFCYKRSRKYDDRIYMIDDVSGRKFSFAELWHEVHRLAVAIQEKGFQKGQRFCVVTHNCIECPIIWFAIASLGGVVVPLNPLLTEGELLGMLENSEPSFIFTSEDAANKILRTSQRYGRLRDVFVIGNVGGLTSFESLLRLGDIIIGAEPKTDFQNSSEVDPVKDLISLFYSSGTTGLPKACMHAHYNWTSAIFNSINAEVLHMREGKDVTIATVPMFHVYGAFQYFGIALCQGCTVVIPAPKFQVEQYLRLVEKYRATCLLLVPSLFARIGQNPRTSEYDLSSIQTVLSSASGLKPVVIDQFRKKFPKNVVLAEEYGMTEVLACTRCEIFPDQSRTSGQVLPNVFIKVVDIESGRRLGPNEDGEICVKSPSMLMGYWKNPQAFAATVDDEGYFRTGDFGHYDDQKRLFIVDRIKDVLKQNGFQVNPSELESILLLHPMISEATVVGKPDDMAGDLVTAFVVLREKTKGDQQMDILHKDIQAFVNLKVAPQKKLRGGIRFVDSIPKTTSGKVLRRILKKSLIEELESSRQQRAKL